MGNHIFSDDTNVLNVSRKHFLIAIGTLENFFFYRWGSNRSICEVVIDIIQISRVELVGILHAR